MKKIYKTTANFDLLTEEEQLNEQTNWNQEQWWEFFSREGVFSYEEFSNELDRIILEVYGD